jgi:uncharacterized protein (DUF2252 family)
VILESASAAADGTSRAAHVAGFVDKPRQKQIAAVVESRSAMDQTVIGNPARDLIRLGLSLATAARGSDLPGITD